MQPNYQPQGYPQQYPQGYAQPAYQQHQQQPAQQPPASLPAGDFADPRAGGGDLAPRIRHLVGRTVIIEPLRIDENAKGMPDSSGQTPIRPAAYAHVTVVDGGPIAFGDEIKAGRQVRPNTHQVPAPYRITNMMISNTWIVNAIRDAMPPMGNGLLLGVIEEGTQGNRPFLLTKVETNVDGSDRPDGAQRRATARQVWDAIKAGAFTNPTPVLLQPVAGSAYAGGMPQQHATPYGPTSVPGPAPQYHQPAPDGYGQAYAAPVVSTATGQPVVHQRQVPAPVATGTINVELPPGFDVTQVPPGWDAGAWEGFKANPQQAAAIWTNVLAQQAGTPAAPVQQQQPSAAPGW